MRAAASWVGKYAEHEELRFFDRHWKKLDKILTGSWGIRDRDNYERSKFYFCP